MRLQLQGVSFSYQPSIPVVNGISMDVASGETVAIVGPSGCGKTTILRIVAGILQADGPSGSSYSGTVHYGDGENLRDLRRKGDIGYMFQSPMLFPFLTVSDNVAFPFNGIAPSAGKSISRCEQLLDVVGMKLRRTNFPAELSGGMRTRVALARTFATDPRLLLLDEPFGSLDIAWRLALYNELREMQKCACPTTILVTHDLDEAFLLSNRIFIMGLSGGFLGTVSRSTAPSAPLNLEGSRHFLRSNQDQILDVQNTINADVVRMRAKDTNR